MSPLPPPRLLTTVFLLLTAGCVDPFLEPEPSDDPVTNFRLLWEGFDRHYSYFGQKELDWLAARDRFGSMVTPETSDAELFDVMSRMLLLLRDGHVNLYTPLDTFRYTGWFEDAPRSFNPEWISFFYIRGDLQPSPGFRVFSGDLGSGLGYIRIANFGGEGWVRYFDEALDLLTARGMQGLVLDIRDNPGGSDRNTRAVAGRFVQRQRLYRYFQYRNGPDHDDFTELFEDHVEPRTPHFDGPVAVLTNRRVFSAGEDFVLAMRVAGATIVGDTTGGGYGNPMGRELPNGWTYRLSRWREWTADEELLVDGEGLVPDIHVSFFGGFNPGQDPILEAAMAHLRNVIAGDESSSAAGVMRKEAGLDWVP
jgi:hypothetical protein